MKYLPFEIWEYNDYKDDATATLKSDTGILYVYIGKLAIQITQNDNGESVEIFALDAELLEQELGTLQVRFDDIKDYSSDSDNTHSSQ